MPTLHVATTTDIAATICRAQTEAWQRHPRPLPKLQPVIGAIVPSTTPRTVVGMWHALDGADDREWGEIARAFCALHGAYAAVLLMPLDGDTRVAVFVEHEDESEAVQLDQALSGGEPRGARVPRLGLLGPRRSNREAM